MTTADFRHQGEFHDHGDLGERSNKIRAAVLGGWINVLVTDAATAEAVLAT